MFSCLEGQEDRRTRVQEDRRTGGQEDRRTGGQEEGRTIGHDNRTVGKIDWLSHIPIGVYENTPAGIVV